MKMNNKWHLVLSGILFLLLNTCMATDLSCGQFLANYLNSTNFKTGNFETLMRALSKPKHTQIAGKSCGYAANFIYYLMHQKNIKKNMNKTQLEQDIINFFTTTSSEDQSKEKISQVLNNEFLQNKEDDIPRTVICSFSQSFTQNEEFYVFPGINHVFVIEKGGKNEFRLWQAWINSYSILEWVHGEINGEKKDKAYTKRELPLSRNDAQHLINDLIMFSDSNLDWNQRQHLSAKMFWSTKNVFLSHPKGDNYYFDSNGKATRIHSCDEDYGTAYSVLKNEINTQLNVTVYRENLEKRRIDSGNYCEEQNNFEWLLYCDENVFSSNHSEILKSYHKCYSNISKNIDLTNVPNLPKVEIEMNCEVTNNANDGHQCRGVLADIHNILNRKSS